MKNQTPNADSDKNEIITPTKKEEKIVDETLKETFPASDAPAWYAGKDKVKPKK